MWRQGMRWGLVLLVSVLAAAPRASTPSDPIDKVIAAEMPASGAPGLAYAIVEDGRVRSGVRGETRLGGGRPVTPDTPFLLGSISKSFTAMAVMQLAEAGKVDLDAGIAAYLEAFAGRPSGAITIRQLLSHTSGFSTRQGNQPISGEDGLSGQARRIARWTPDYAPGTRWAYSNANYQLLGALIEAVSGEPFGPYVESHILRPIGMTHSFVADGKPHEEMATGHRPWFGFKRPRDHIRTDRLAGPQGGVIASAPDLARYLAVMMNGADDVISAQSKAEMMRPAGKASPFYGLGWLVDTGRGTVFHSGASPGVETLAVLVPAQNKAAVVLVNAGGGVGFGETLQLRNAVAARALGLPYAGETGALWRKMLFICLVLLTPVFLCSMVWAWRHRAALRAKSGAFGLFSLWFPVFTTLGMAWVLVWLVPRLNGASLGTLRLYQPDLALTLVTGAVTGVMWALFRLGVAYLGKTGPSRPPVAGEEALRPPPS